MKSVAGIFLALGSIFLSSCSGGSGSGSVTPTTPNPTPVGGVSTMSAVQIQGCPLGDFTTIGKLPDGVSGCMHGTVSGVTTLGGTDACTVEYDGTSVSYKSKALSITLVLDAATKAQFQHGVNNGKHSVTDWRTQFSGLKTTNYVNFLYDQAMDITPANVIVEVLRGSERGSCYGKL